MTIEPGDVVLIGGRDTMWVGCLMQVEAVKAWGVSGVIPGPKAILYPLRLPYSDISAVFRKVSDEDLQ